ncbi:MAG TPA: 23S rRNA (pseudouridine(1915)-N(3))-methyltransferase RlmH [Blastocatellia bacterium]|nr:23S rRNA (pseudouridine(1915)-N(3))-methyltransferase RlmH [Blastocatellia bacterium]
MKLRFVWIGKAKSGPVRELVEDYIGRVKRFAHVTISELRDRDDAGGDARRVIEKEGEAILSAIESDPFVVLLDERGREVGSEELAGFLERHRLGGTRQITFVIGGHAGVSEGVRRRADFTLALSKMTLTHEMARVLLVEQVYRAFTILHGLPYQK